MRRPSETNIGIIKGTTIEFGIELPEYGQYGVYPDIDDEEQEIIGVDYPHNQHPDVQTFEHKFEKPGRYQIKVAVAETRLKGPRNFYEVPNSDIKNIVTWTVFCTDPGVTDEGSIGRTAWKAIQAGTTIYTIGSAGKHLSDKIQNSIRSQEENLDSDADKIDKRIKTLDEF